MAVRIAIFVIVWIFFLVVSLADMVILLRMYVYKEKINPRTKGVRGYTNIRKLRRGAGGLVIFSHPDSDRRYRNHTCSASRRMFVDFTTGMDFHHSPKTIWS